MAVKYQSFVVKFLKCILSDDNSIDNIFLKKIVFVFNRQQHMLLLDCLICQARLEAVK